MWYQLFFWQCVLQTLICSSYSLKVFTTQFFSSVTLSMDSSSSLILDAVHAIVSIFPPSVSSTCSFSGSRNNGVPSFHARTKCFSPVCCKISSTIGEWRPSANTVCENTVPPPCRCLQNFHGVLVPLQFKYSCSRPHYFSFVALFSFSLLFQITITALNERNNLARMISYKMYFMPTFDVHFVEFIGQNVDNNFLLSCFVRWGPTMIAIIIIAHYHYCSRYHWIFSDFSSCLSTMYNDNPWRKGLCAS